MGFGDPDHQHPLILTFPEKDLNCFRCELPIADLCYGCTRCDHFVHQVCFSLLPHNMTHPLHPQHSLTLSSSPASSSQITGKCNQCLEPFFGGYAYHCQSCPQFNLHLKCFLTFNLETKHHHPLSFSQADYFDKKYCHICGLLIDCCNSYVFACAECNYFIHFDCAFLAPKVKHHHVHELTFQHNYPEGSKIVDCDVCLDDKELDRTLSYYYCEKCDYIAHVHCVTSQPTTVTTQLDHFSHEHPMTYLRNPNHDELTCAACKCLDKFDSFYFCGICNYALHKSCAQFPRFIKHPRHSHTLCLQSSACKNKDGQLVYCEFCTKGKGWILRCSDCDYAVQLSRARFFEHPLYEDKILSFSSYEETKFRCNACGDLGDGFRMSRREYWYPEEYYDLHIECFALPGQIEHGCHLHPLYLVTSPMEIESYSSTIFQCGICDTEADPDFWVYCCMQCKYIAHLKCVVSDLLPLPGGRSCDLSNFCSIVMCEKEKFKVSTTLVDCSKLIELVMASANPIFLHRGFFNGPNGDHNHQPITSDVTDLDKSDLLCCPKCEQPISAQPYSSAWDWVHLNFKASIYKIQNETRVDHESLGRLDEKVVDELYCPICNLLIYPPTYSCADCEIFFHKSCAELPRKYTVDTGHTLVLQSPSMDGHSLRNCSLCQHPIKGCAYFCASCEIGYDVTCALGAPLLKIENQKHSFFASTMLGIHDLCKACGNQIIKEKVNFRCGAPGCNIQLHVECALLPSMVKVTRRIHHHPLVLAPHLDLSVDDYICDVCEKELNPCIWVYRCSDSCGDRATSHVSCIVTSNKKKSHFVYDQECSYPHLEQIGSLKQKAMMPSALATALVNEPPEEQEKLIRKSLLSLVDELEHEYAYHVIDKLMLEMNQSDVLHLMESPDALRAKVTETMKHFTSLVPVANDENKEDEDRQIS